ncbi:MAG: hypothetical protein ACFB00_08935 [Parvularculaceae bacterium]
MIRVLLPLAVIAILLFAPVFGDKVEGSEIGGGVVQLTGYDYTKKSIDCWLGGDFSLVDECAPESGLKGLSVFFAIFIAAVAAALGVIGLVPFIGRITSFVTTVAGVVIIGAIAFYVLQSMGSDEGIAGVQWGAYVAGGGGLLTTIFGLSGMRGD